MTTPRVFIITTGAGAGAQQEIWKTPGCSSWFEGAAFPYGQEQQDEFFGFMPAHYVNEDAAIRFAMAAYQRAWRPGGAALGVGLTAVVAGLKLHRGDHRIHFAVMSDTDCRVGTIVLTKGLEERRRGLDGALADQVVAELISTGQSAYALTRKHQDGQERALELLLERPLRTERGTRDPIEAVQGFTLFPGAFNPPHEGHHGIRAAVGRSRPFAFVISVDHPHKPHLTPQELLQREKLLKGHNVLLLKEAPRYIDQAERFPESHFVLGADALERVLDPRWYVDCPGNSIERILSRFSYLGTKFLVVPRDGVTTDHCFDKAKVDLKYRLMFQDIDFVSDASSTKIRGG